MAVTCNFWKNKRVLVTGHTGFKGSWLCLWLQQMGADVTGFALEPPSSPSLFVLADVAQNMKSVISDIRDQPAIKAVIEKAKPDIVFHLAAQSLVRASYIDPTETYSTNVMGSVNLLEAIRQVDCVHAVVMVSTDKCYENQESKDGYREEDRLGGFDPYSSSKACQEILVASYRDSFFADKNNKTFIASARAGNVIGGGDYAQDRLVPDLLKAITKGQDVALRYPHAIRPWQHVLEPLSGYLILAEKLYVEGAAFAKAWNFAPDQQSHKTVAWIAKRLIQLYGSQSMIKSEQTTPLHETSCLTLNADLAKAELGWYPKWDINTTLKYIVDWQQTSVDKKQQCLKHILAYHTAKGVTC